MTTLRAFKIGSVNYLMIILKTEDDTNKIKYEIMGSLGTHVCCSINILSGEDEMYITQCITDVNETLVFKYSIDDNSDFMFINYSDLLKKDVSVEDNEGDNYYCVKKNIHIDIDYMNVEKDQEKIEEKNTRNIKLYKPVSDEYDEYSEDNDEEDIDNEIGIAALFDMNDSDSLEGEMDLCEHCGDLCEGEDAVDAEGISLCPVMNEMFKENSSSLIKLEPLKVNDGEGKI